MIDSTKLANVVSRSEKFPRKPIDDATPFDDVSGLKLSKSRSYSLKEIYIKEAENIE